MEAISATIITLNEETNIERCLNSLLGLVDEIVVVDSGSSDNTVEICRRYGCHVVERSFNGYGLQRQFATSLTSHNYIIAIDADEALDEDLHNQIKRIKAEGFQHRVYAMPTIQYCMGQRIHQPADNAAPIRLFNKRYAQWNLDDIGERVTFPTSLRPEPLRGNLLHYRSGSIAELRNKEIRQAKINALKYAGQNGIPGWPKAACKAIKTYLRTMVRDRAILDGKTGRTIAGIRAGATYKALRELKGKA